MVSVGSAAAVGNGVRLHRFLRIPVDKRDAGRYGVGGFWENEGEWLKES